MASLESLVFGHTYDLKDNFVEGGGVNMNNALTLPIMLDQEASTDIDLVLLSSIGSDGGGSINSMDWTSLESMSSPVEMRLHGSLPVRNSEDLITPRKFPFASHNACSAADPLQLYFFFLQLLPFSGPRRLQCQNNVSDLKENFVKGNMHMHSVFPTSTILDEEASTDMGLALLSSLGGGSIISMCWTSMELLEMQLFEPLPVRSLEDLIAPVADMLQCALQNSSMVVGKYSRW
ncbi:unnamed protein product, partial [Dibothriocephalus latus]